MEATELLQDIAGQSLISGLLFFLLWKVWQAFQTEKDKKDLMAEALIKLTQSWEDRYSKESTDEREIKLFMSEIRDLIRDLKNAK